MIQDFLQRLAAFLDRPFFPWKKLIIGFSLGEFALENWLLFRQYRVLSRPNRPKALAEEISQEKFEKSQKYGQAKAKFSFISSVFQQIKNLATIHYDVLPKLWSITGILLARYAPERFSGEITHSLVFLFAMSAVETLINLPFSYYHTFVLEESYGFNKTTLNTWVADIFKGQALSIAFGVPLGAAFLKIIKATGQSFFYYIWLFMFVVQVGAITIYPIFIVPIFNKLEPLKPGPLKEAVEALASKLEFPLDELQVIDGSKRSAHSNAYFAGTPWKKRIVIYDTLLEHQSDEEITAVLGHELGHWKMNHTTRLLCIGQVHTFYLFALFSAFVNNRSVYESFGFHNQMPTIIGFLLFSSILSPTDSVMKLLMNMMTRKMEFEADKFAVDLGYASQLSSSLIKLNIENLSSMDADWMYSSFHHSHPILTERLRAIGWTAGSSSKVLDNEKPEKAADREL